MKLGQRIAIFCDHTVVESAQALRAVLEAYRMQVDFHRATQMWQVKEFFNQRAREYAYIIIDCHGSSAGTAGQRLVIEAIEPRRERPDLGDMKEFHLTPKNIPQELSGFKGTLISMACESGREVLASAFLQAGCKAYIAPTEYHDTHSGIVFVSTLFYLLHHEWLLPDAITYSLAEAVELARNVHTKAEFGTKVWKLYEHK